jgi:hypothetical protein
VEEVEAVIIRQQHGKHISVATDADAKIKDVGVCYAVSAMTT